MIYKSLIFYTLILFINFALSKKQNFKDVSRRLLFDSSFVKVKNEQQGSYDFWKNRDGKDIEHLNTIEFESKLRQLNMTRESFNKRYNLNIKYSDDSIDSDDADIVRKIFATIDTKGKNTKDLKIPFNMTNTTTRTIGRHKSTGIIGTSAINSESSSSSATAAAGAAVQNQNNNSIYNMTNETNHKDDNKNIINSLNSDDTTTTTFPSTPTSALSSQEKKNETNGNGNIHGVQNSSDTINDKIIKNHKENDPEVFVPVNADGSLVFSHVPVNFSTTDIEKSDNGTYTVISSNTTGHLDTLSKIEVINQSRPEKSNVPINSTNNLPRYPPEFDLTNENKDKGPNHMNNQESDRSKTQKEVPTLPIDIVPVPKTTTTSTSENFNKINSAESTSLNKTTNSTTKSNMYLPPIQPIDISKPTMEPEISHSIPSAPVPISKVPSTPSIPSTPAKEPETKPFISSSTLRCSEVPN